MLIILAKLRHFWQEELREQLSQAKTSVPLCALALLFACAASAVIILLRLCIDWLDSITHISVMDFSGLITDWRILLPIIGAVLIRLTIAVGSQRYKRMGIAYVIHKFNTNYGKLPLVTVPAQFFQALFALACNFSVGREGPAIHLGAATASALAQRCNLPNNSIRIMCASGIAAGIAAVFNSPFAAVIFVFEVIIRDYRIHYFIPVMLAAICGAISSQLVFGNVHEFGQIQAVHMPVDQYPLLTLVAIVLGVCAAGFNTLLIHVTALAAKVPLTSKILLAGVITAAIGLYFPQALGTGERAIDLAIHSQPSINFLVVLLLAKVMATVAAIGLGIPGGLIGPLYGIGALIGTIMALLSVELFPDLSPYIGLYTVIGMTAMMGVCLSAPMAALVALLELTNNAAIILPSMFVTTVAFFIAYRLLNSESIFLRQLDLMGLGYHNPMINKGLQTLGVRALLNKDFAVMTAMDLANNRVPKHSYLLVKNTASVAAQSLEEQLPNLPEALAAETQVGQYNLVHLSPHPEQQYSLEPMIGLCDTASLNDAYQVLKLQHRGQVYIYHEDEDNILGVISWQQLEEEIHLCRL
ncbi:chloride channel protein [Shewanella sp. NFH-SH190041]|uniref:chloride channel protein n=1 Tax=Shewanella sp. NFH-SH190041 TaxID=2950245 RepID=UPI0021C2D24A